MAIQIQEKWNINGIPQYVSIRSDKTDAPLLLYLHGGPGDAALPLVLKYNRALEKYFTVVVWEQRGAGKSYYPFEEREAITIDTFVQDLYALVTVLLEQFHQEKLFLVGHSWGSVLGLRFIEQHPEQIRAYAGCGQVVNMKKSCRIAWEYAFEHANAKEKQRLRQIDCSYQGHNWMKDLLYVTKLVVAYQGSLYGESSYRKLTLPFLFSGAYSLPDVIRRQKGSLQSIQFLWPELMQTNFEASTRFQVPVLFVEGKFDYHVSSALAKQYFDTIETQKQFFLFEKSCHFPQWSENEAFNQLLIESFL